MAKQKDYGLIFWFHLAVILFWYVSPFLFSWYLLLFGVAFSYLQGIVLNGCVLTHKQFGKDNNITFWGYYLEKVGIKIKKETAKIIFFWLEPWIVLIVAFILQVLFKFKPILI